jgi:signal transduction histidine kinase
MRFVLDNSVGWAGLFAHRNKIECGQKSVAHPTGLRSSGTQTEFIVADNGPGIAEAYRLKVFQRFYRLEQSRTTPGNGLGLNIVAAVADLHGGTIALADNNPGLRIVLNFCNKQDYPA